jgi:hypothetical protein
MKKYFNLLILSLIFSSPSFADCIIFMVRNFTQDRLYFETGPNDQNCISYPGLDSFYLDPWPSNSHTQVINFNANHCGTPITSWLRYRVSKDTRSQPIGLVEVVESRDVYPQGKIDSRSTVQDVDVQVF